MSRKRLLLIFLSFVWFNAAILNAAFTNSGAFTRSVGLGDAFSSISDDISAVQYNPGGLGAASRNEITVQYSSLYAGLTDNSSPVYNLLGLLRKIKYGSIGLTYSYLGGLQYTENVFSLAYGLNIFGSFYAGGSLKYMGLSIDSDKYTKDDPALQGYPLSLFNYDLGLLVITGARYRISLAIRNMGNNVIGVVKPEELPSEIRIGIGGIGETTRLDFDLVSVGDHFSLCAGFEKSIGRMLSLRCGLSAGSGGLANISTGLTLGYRGIYFDYAFRYPLSGIAGTYGSHYGAITFNFDKGRDILKTEAELKVEQLEKQMAEKEKLQKEKEETIAAKEEELKKAQAEKVKLENEVKAAKKEARRGRTGMIAGAGSDKGFLTENIKHTVLEKDTLQSLAEKYYGDQSRWKLIYNSNREKIRSGQLVPDTELIIPDVKKEQKEEDADLLE